MTSQGQGSLVKERQEQPGKEPDKVKGHGKGHSGRSAVGSGERNSRPRARRGARLCLLDPPILRTTCEVANFPVTVTSKENEEQSHEASSRKPGFHPTRPGAPGPRPRPPATWPQGWKATSARKPGFVPLEGSGKRGRMSSDLHSESRSWLWAEGGPQRTGEGAGGRPRG